MTVFDQRRIGNMVDVACISIGLCNIFIFWKKICAVQKPKASHAHNFLSI